MGRAYRKKRFYTTRERLLIHLSEDGRSESARLPLLTQEGIAGAILSGRSTVTKWIAKLEEQALIAGGRAHVPGHVVRKTIYRLTPDGWDAARRMRDRLLGDLVEVRARGLDSVLLPVADLPVIFPTQLSLTLAVSLVSEGRIDLTGLPETRPEAPAPLVWGSSLRRPDRVIGRGRELEALDAWMKSSVGILAVVGIAGIGKTALVTHWIFTRAKAGHVFWHELSETSTLRQVLADLAAFLRHLGRQGLASSLAETGETDPSLAARTLAHVVRGLSILVVLDRFERVPAAVGRVLGNVLVPLTESNGTKLLVISRTLPRFVADLQENRAHEVEVVRLPGLGSEEAVDLLRMRGLAADEPTLTRVATSAKGHPLLLSLIAQGGAAAAGTIDRYLETEIWTGLAPEEREALEAASVFRGAVRRDILESFAEVTDSTLTSLRVKTLLEPTVAGGLGVHDVIREFVRGRVGPRRLRALHRRAADILLKQPEPKDRLEGLYHLLEADRFRDVAAFLETQGSTLVDSVSVQLIADLLRGRNFDAADAMSGCVFAEYLGDSLRIAGDLGPARQQYAHAIQASEAKGLVGRVPRLLRKLACIERRRSSYPRALGYLIEAQARLSETHVPQERVEVLRELGLVQQGLGDLESAVAHLNESIDLATELSIPAAITRGILALGTIEAQLGHSERSLTYKLEGLRMAERSGNMTEIARGCIHVGTAHAAMRRYRDSLPYYDRGYRLAQLLGNIRLMAYAAMNRASALIDMGRYEEAGSVHQEARCLFEIIGEPEALALLSIHEGNREFGLGRWNRAKTAWERGLQELRKLGDQSDLVRSLKEIGIIRIEHGEPEGGRAYLKEAEELAARLGNERLRADIRSILDGTASGAHPRDAVSQG